MSDPNNTRGTSGASGTSGGASSGAPVDGPPAPVDGSPAPPAEDRFALLSSWRWVVPLAIVAGLAVGFELGQVARWVCWGGSLLILALWLVGRVSRPFLVVDATGYRVVEGVREKLRVPFDAVRRVRAVPAEEAMYVDCGDPAKNLLLPPRRGYGFRFERQRQIYVRLARALADRVEVVARLEAAPEPPTEKSHE